MPDNIFDIRGVTLQRGGQFVLDDVSLRIERSASLMIIGPSGSGKSSLLRCLNRLETINSGQVVFAGTDIAVLSVLELRQRVGMVFQRAAVFPGTVADNIAYGPGLRGQTLARSEILDLMRQAALEADLIDRDARELRGGQEQRLAIAENILKAAQAVGVAAEDILFDPLAMTVSVNHRAAQVTINTARSIREKLGTNMTIGASNTSHGMPDRQLLNTVFLAGFIQAGVNAPICNPLTNTLAVRAIDLMQGHDEWGMRYIQTYRKLQASQS